MAGAMRRMGIYLGLVEDDDARGYGRYDARQADYADHPDDRHYGRYPDEGYDEQYGDYDKGRYAPAGYAEPSYAEDRAETERPAPVRDPEAAPARRGPTGRPIGLAPAPAPAPAAAAPGAGQVRAGAPAAGAGATAAGLAVREKAAAEPAPAPAPAPVVQPYRITTVHPRTYNEARTIGERYREGCPVIMNLTELDDADAKRLVDFAAGLIFGLRGSIERVTAKVFLLSPQDVDVTAEDKARIREGGFFNQS
jgi:cell division inhibitor SepF